MKLITGWAGAMKNWVIKWVLRRQSENLDYSGKCNSLCFKIDDDEKNNFIPFGGCYCISLQF